MEITTYGLDPAPTHGCLVQATWDDDKLVDHEIVYLWKDGPGIKAPLNEVIRLGRRVVDSLPSAFPITVPEPGFPVMAVDWDDNAGYWSANKKQMIRFSFLVGGIIQGVIDKGIVPVFIRPADVRKALGLKANVEKKQVIGLFLDTFDLRKYITDKNEDYRDSLLLSYLASVKKRRGGVLDGITPETG